MFKRVLLLVCLVACLVVPVCSVCVTVPATLDAWNVTRGSWSDSGGLHPTAFDGAQRARIEYTVPDGLSLADDFDLVYSASWDNSAPNTLGFFDLLAYDANNTQVMKLYVDDGYKADSRTVIQAWFGSLSLTDTAYSTTYSNFDGDVVFSRRGDVGTLYVGGVAVLNGSVASLSGNLSTISINCGNIEGSLFPVLRYVGGSFEGGDIVLGIDCTINIYDADTRLPLSGSWDYYIVIQGADSISGSASGASTAVSLPATSILQPHLVYVTKEGYEMTPGVVAFDVPAGGREIKIYMTPLETVGQPGYRTGTVTMTDHNGTSISGFEVTAVNHYTGEEYTIATDTDVAVMTLPMDRVINIRNPQTGEYEEVPIGYYRFYGHAPGYKMLFEDGIKVSVWPEKYGSYQLCDIGVMSDSGPLTGKHKFQIRSRSDNSVLQTGTISAKSATTGEWFNTTVSGGIATLVLPYDTSNPISQYAGNYYVYPTSPGYEENDFGTQIVVMPHTVSEIKTVFLTPIGGIPTPGNVTLRIQAISETGPGVVNAEIFIAGVLGAGKDVWDTYTASSTGYLSVSVPGNSTYDIVARGAGFYDSSRRIQVFTDDPGLIEMRLYLSGAPTIEPTDEPTGWPTDPPSTQPTGGIPDDDDDSDGFLVQAVRGIGLAFGVGFSTAKIIFGMLLALAIGFTTAKQLRGGAAEFGMGMLGGTMLGVLIGLLPVWIIVVLLLVVGLYIGNRYVGGNNNG